ncbi:MAG: TaqI-like C-terminal specificity domain-containing protein, partial [Bacteroidales bacterium]|nr:TaqI-like C-terminal specificity domain-containing protein [Bacteroidales bacterium]
TENERNSGSLIENAIIQLDSLDKISRLENPLQYGNNYEEKLFSIGLELSITWINRILFLKLLEAQLIKYHKGDKTYSFLNSKKIQNYDDLNTLFFQVLAKKHENRNSVVKNDFEKVPFLNSSLFEPTEIEHTTVLISNLRDDQKLPIFSSTVLKDNTGKKRTGELTTLEYLFEFLDSYDFSSEGAEDIQEDNKTLINASVLGLIFEKINGYKDGSFFTPGFITMYMCQETIRRAVLQKFNETKGWNCENLDSVYDKIENRQEANNIVNSIKICDPAVGSGHFLVSALNEIIAIKNDLKILQDRDGKRLKEYQIEVVNDELIITDEDGELFDYNPNSKESQRVQETLFHEKQTIIENCLFGVDINPNSVKICRLRLWIELLKNAYYKNETELETLPNIDINIKCGNSLVSRFSLDSDLKQALKQSKWSIDMYRVAVQTYRNAENKEQKHEMEKLIKTIKTDFRSEIAANSKEIKDLSKWKGELANLVNQTRITLFEKTTKEKKEFDQKAKNLTEKIKNQENLIEEIKNNKIYENAFEWRFEFPEVLNDDGDFVGFDVVIGNPPYIRHEDLHCLKPYLKTQFQIYNSTADILTYFVEKSYKILKEKGVFQFIISNKFTRANYGKELRHFLQYKTQISHFIDFNGLAVFDEASVDAAILGFVKHPPCDGNSLINVKISKNSFTHDLFLSDIKNTKNQYQQKNLNEFAWIFENEVTRNIKEKVENNSIKLKELELKMYYGIKTGLNNAFIIDSAVYQSIIEQDSKSKDFIKPMLRGQDILKYYTNNNDKWLIYVPKGYTIKTMLKIQDGTLMMNEPTPRYGYVEYDEAWEWFKQELPVIAKHLEQFREQAEKRFDQGDYWWELRACAYIKEFENPKIIYKDIAQRLTFCYDENAYFTNNTNYFITGNVNLKYLTAILNSKLMDFYYRLISTQLGENAVRLFTQYVENIPVKQVTETIETVFAGLIDEIVLYKSESKDTSKLEAKIDNLVYELYGLSEDEIGFVEGSF